MKLKSLSRTGVLYLSSARTATARDRSAISAQRKRLYRHGINGLTFGGGNNMEGITYKQGADGHLVKCETPDQNNEVREFARERLRRKNLFVGTCGTVTWTRGWIREG